MIRAGLILAVLALSACGADGPPITPSMTTTVGVGSDGLRTSADVTLKRGPVTIGGGF